MIETNAARESDINTVLGELEKVLAFVGEEQELLEQRLGRILRDEPDAPKDTANPVQSRVPLATEIGKHVSALHRIGERLQSVRNRIEL